MIGGHLMIMDTLDGGARVLPDPRLHRNVDLGSERFSTLFCMRVTVMANGDGYGMRKQPEHRGDRPAPRS